MKKAAVLLTLIVLAVSSLSASDNWWWNEPGPPVEEESEPLPGDITSGELKMLIIVSKFPEDTAVLRPALYDSLITDSMEYVDDSLYQWSVTNFLYTASWKQLEMTGEVNPWYTYPFYVTAPHSLQWYRDRFSFGLHTGNIIDTFERDIIGVVDPFVNFNDYDANHDGCVDYVFFIHPLCPNTGFVQDTFDTPDSSNHGFAATYSHFYTDDSLNNTPIKVNRRARCGSAMSFYHSDTSKRIDRATATNLICHEFGHSFGGGTPSKIKYTNGNFYKFLPDRYDRPTNSNLYAGSGGVGKYSVMQLGYYTLHPQLYTPWERMVFGWIEPAEITENSQNMILKDFNAYSTDLSQKAYVIPVDSVAINPGGFNPHWVREYFLIANYQPTTHWLDDLGETWPEELDSAGPADSAHGVLIWHVNEWFWRTDSQPTELMKFEDLECAEGLMNLTGDGPSPMGTIIGWDRIDRWCPGASDNWNENHVDGSASHPHDFFNPAYKGAFHTLTNPSSDGYNCDLRSYDGPRYFSPLYPYTYPSEGSGGSEAEEQMVLQNLPTHVALEGIEYNGGTDIKLCIRRSRIWIDQPTAMDRTTQRKFICDTTDTFHFVYPLKGNVYYTRTHAPDSIWYKAEKVGPHPVYYDSIGYGIWPALTLDEEREPLVVFYDTSCSEVIYSYREEVSRTIGSTAMTRYTVYDTVWHSPPCTLDLAGDPGPVAIDYGFGDGVVTNPGAVPVMLAVGGEGTVHLAYLTRVGNHDELHYAYFPKYHPEDLTVDTLENNLAIDNNRDMGVSIEVDIPNDKICIAYGCYKDTLGRGDTLPAIYYREKLDTLGWTPAYPFDFTLNSPTISRTSGEPLVPFIDPDDGYLRIVFNANDKILFNYAVVKSDTMNLWCDTFITVVQDTNQNRYPQIGGNMVTWTKVVGADSNVYACKTPRFNEFKLSIYPEENWFCHVTKADTSAACLYQQGTFFHPEPRWAVYYRGPCGFGGNQESDGPGSRLIPTEPEFSMSVSRNILRGNQFSVFTTGECELAAYDVTGRRIAKLIIEAQPLGGEVETPIDCKNWASGIYFLRAVHEGESSTVIRTEKVVLLR